MSNYSATVVRIDNLRPHSNANRLQLTTIFGNTVIVGLDTKLGDLGLYFPLESQIGLEYAQANDLLRRKDADGKPTGGMFDANRRVRAQILRGERSMGFFMPIESLNILKHVKDFGFPVEALDEGLEIEKFGDVIISQKYIARATRLPGSARKEGRQTARESRVVPGQFHFHFETAQLGKNIHKLNPDDLVSITWKMHGTSAIAGNMLTKRKLTLIERLLVKFGVPVIDYHYEMIYASRRVIKNEFEEAKQHYYKTDLWSTIGKYYFDGMLKQGETVYYEIVGFTPEGAPIQKGYDYGCDSAGLGLPTNKLFIYRITMTAPDGTITELQWNQLKERSKELDVPTVPESYYGKAVDLFDDVVPGEHWNQNFLERLKEAFVYDQDSQFCTNSVPEEGIVVRKEGLQIEVFKLKSFRFLQHETKELDKGELNIEDEQSVVDDGDEDIRI